MPVYGARPYGSRAYGDAAGGASALVIFSGTGSVTYTLTNDIVVTGRGAILPQGTVTYNLSNSLTVGARASNVASVTYNLVNNVFFTPHGIDGIGTGQPVEINDQKILWIYNLSGVKTMACTEFLAFEWEIRLQEREVLRWSLKSEDPKVAYIDLDQTVKWNNRRFIVTQVTPQRQDTETLVYYEAEARWIELGDIVRRGTYALSSVSVDAGLSILTANTAWTYAPTGDTSTHSITGTDTSILSLLRSWALVSNKEIQFDTENRVIVFMTQQGSLKSTGFRYGRNLLNIKKQEERVAATRLYLTGNGELELASPGYIEDYSYYTSRGLTLPQAQAQFLRIMRLNLDSIVTQTDLTSVATRLLATLAIPQISYHMDVKEMTIQSGYDFTDASIGDSVPVWDPVLGTTLLYPRVVRLLRKPWEMWDSVVELSTLEPDLTQAGLTGSGGGTSDWQLIKHDSPLSLSVGTAEQNVNYIEVQFINGEAVFGYEMDGTASGSGTVTFTFYDALTGQILGPVINRLFTAGVFHEVGSFALKELNG